MAFSVNRIDHVVINCRDADTTSDWYVRVLGMEREVFGEGRVALRFGNQRINVRPTGAPITASAGCRGTGIPDGRAADGAGRGRTAVMSAPSSDRLESIRATLGRGTSRAIGTAVPKVREVLPPTGQAGTSLARKVASAAAIRTAATVSSPARAPTSTPSAGTFGDHPKGDSFSSQPGTPSR